MTSAPRFAPSPTGGIQIGNLRSAPLNRLFARRDGGTFQLHFDDTGQERSREEYVEGIRKDLENHVANTGVQIQLLEALGAAPPAFAHHNLLVSAGGQALPKRVASLSTRSFREEALEALAVLSHSATIGTSHAVAPYTSLNALASLFDFDQLSCAPARFDTDELKSNNVRLLQKLAYSEVAGRLAAAAIRGGEAFWNAVRGNLRIFDDVKHWWAIVNGRITREIESEDVLAAAGRTLDPLWMALTGHGGRPKLEHLSP